MKPYDVGVICGRFQHIHSGHESLINNGLLLCDRILILVGSAQEVATERNPFDIETRISLIKAIYGEQVTVKPLNDLTHENDVTPEWGRYFLSNVKRVIHKNPEIMIYGNDEARSRWFDLNDISGTSEFIVPRNRLPISATQMRQFIVKDDQEEWMKYTNPKIHKYYDKIRAELMSVEHYRNLLNT